MKARLADVVATFCAFSLCASLLLIAVEAGGATTLYQAEAAPRARGLSTSSDSADIAPRATTNRGQALLAQAAAVSAPGSAPSQLAAAKPRASKLKEGSLAYLVATRQASARRDLLSEHLAQRRAALARVSVVPAERGDGAAAPPAPAFIAPAGEAAPKAPAQIARQPLPGVRSADAPILMYHHVGPLPEDADRIRRGLTVSAQDFAAQMEILHSQGFTSITLEELTDSLLYGSPLPPKPVVITFDDGYEDNFTYALPALRHFGFKATFFLVTELVGQTGYLTWAQARALAINGMDIEAHGRTHADFTTLSEEGMRDQAATAKQVLEREVGRPVRFFSYPSGKYDERVLRVLAEEGYLAAVTTEYGWEQSSERLLALRRVRIAGRDSAFQFAAKVGAALS